MKIHVECFPDEALLMTLGIPRKNIKHHAGNARVCAALEKLEDERGMIDEEPDKPQANQKFLKELRFVDEKYGIRRFKDIKRGHFVIVICPELEGWITNICDKKDLQKFGLPTMPQDLHKVIINRLRQFRELLIHLEKQENKAILYLKSLLHE